jgi:hypothetical protein
MFQTLTLSTLKPSAWTCFPGKYKFISVAFFFSANKHVTQRATYSLLELFGDIGGLIEFLFFSSRFMFLYLGQIKIGVILASRLFHIEEKKEWSKEKVFALE